MTKNAGVRTSIMFLLVAFLVMFAAGAFVASKYGTGNEITSNTIMMNSRNSIRLPDSDQELPNDGEGTLVIWTKPPVSIFSQFSDARNYIIFFSAKNLPGLRIVYNIQTSRFEAGTPLLTSPPVNIFDEQPHQFVYTFKKDADQAIFLDGVKVNSSAFKQVKISDVTGFVVAVSSIAETDIEGTEVVLYDHYLTEEDIKKMR